MIQEGRLLSEFSTFEIGGPARYFVQVESVEALQKALAFSSEQQIPFLVIGKGSNCLFDDRGFNGLVILNRISFSKIEGNLVSVGAGYSFSLLGVQTAKAGLSGLEFASGIPGSVGGAVYMNAGANGQETAGVIFEVDFVDEKGECTTFSKDQLHFSNRFSSFHQKKGVIAAAKFMLTPLKEAREKQLSIIQYRMSTQPLKEPSCGCVFVNPSGKSAGALIDQLGLKGRRVGGAEISLKHANFIVNKGGAKAADVLELMQIVKTEIKQKLDIDLYPEIRVVPYG